VINSTNRNIALATAFVEELARSGASHAVISPGSRSTPTALALDREPGIAVRVVVDERSAGFVALGLALRTGSPAIVTCTSGSAAANLHPAVVEADQAGVPLLVLTNDRPPELREIGAGQTIDQIKLYGSAVRWFAEAGMHDADDAGLLHMRSLACRAGAEARLGSGPVHVNVSWRDPLGPEPIPGEVTAEAALAIEGRPDAEPLTGLAAARAPSAAVLDQLAHDLQHRHRGVIVCGRQLEPALREPVALLAERAGMPILAEPTSQLRFGSAAAAVVSAYDLILRRPPPGIEPDLVLRFGDTPTSKPLRQWLAGLDCPVVAVDPPGRWDEPTRLATTMVRCDPVALANGLAHRSEHDDDAWRANWLAVEGFAQEAIDAALAEEPALCEPAIHRALAASFEPGDQVLLASSMPVRDHEAFARGRDLDVRFYANRGANGIDGLVSTATGIAAASGAPTWAILGDLALVHDLGGVAALAGATEALTLVVINNGGGGIFDFLPQASQIEHTLFERLFTTPSRIDIAAAASLGGLDYALVEDPGSLGPAATQPTLLELRTDRTDNVAVHARLAEAVQRAVGAAG
jgi:2-succinyl-5-enolpyruvyl-6-hydroxy-3-cyclohexene-1-carboxylate synthase